MEESDESGEGGRERISDVVQERDGKEWKRVTQMVWMSILEECGSKEW